MSRVLCRVGMGAGFGEGFAAAVDGAGLPAGWRRDEDQCAVGSLADLPAALVDEPVVLQADWCAVPGLGFAAEQPVDDVMDHVDAAGAAGAPAAAAVLGVEGVALARGPALALAPDVERGRRPAQRARQLADGRGEQPGQLGG